MNNQKRNKTGLLSCVSTLAIIAAPGSLCASSRTARLVVSTALALGVLLPRDAHAASPKTVNPVQSTTYILNPAYNPITFGSGTNISASGEGVLGPNTYTWAVINQGTISGSGTSEGVGHFPVDFRISSGWAR